MPNGEAGCGRSREKEVSAVRWPSYRGVYVLWCYKELHLLKIGLSAMMPLVASARAPVECDTMVPSEAAQGNPRIGGVSCAPYQSTDV